MSIAMCAVVIATELEDARKESSVDEVEMGGGKGEMHRRYVWRQVKIETSCP